MGYDKSEATGLKFTLKIALVFALIFGAGSLTHAGFQSPESVVRNVYAHYGESSDGGARGLPQDDDTAHNFFDASLQRNWMSSKPPPYDFFVQSPSWKLGPVNINIVRKQFDRTYVEASFANNGKPVSLNFILVKDPDGWVIYDVESTHDSLRLFLQQLKN
jgi:hypothetical protein